MTWDHAENEEYDEESRGDEWQSAEGNQVSGSSAVVIILNCSLVYLRVRAF